MPESWQPSADGRTINRNIVDVALMMPQWASPCFTSPFVLLGSQERSSTVCELCLRVAPSPIHSALYIFTDSCHMHPMWPRGSPNCPPPMTTRVMIQRVVHAPTCLCTQLTHVFWCQMHPVQHMCALRYNVCDVLQASHLSYLPLPVVVCSSAL